MKQGRGDEEEFRETGSGEMRERFVKQGLGQKKDFRETGHEKGGRDA